MSRRRHAQRQKIRLLSLAGVQARFRFARYVNISYIKLVIQFFVLFVCVCVVCTRSAASLSMPKEKIIVCVSRYYCSTYYKAVRVGGGG
jgi:hypothetical protein